MSGEVDSLYIAARRVMLDALEALREQRDAIVLVGAHAIYYFAGESRLPVAAFTTDADFSIAADLLTDDPLLGDLMMAKGFFRGSEVGRWESPSGVVVDLMVPEAIAGPKRKATSRSAQLGVHGKDVARRATGLEGSLVDREWATVASLDPNDDRSVEVWIAGPGALLIAKTHKIYERIHQPNRLGDKDALDIYRLLQAVSTEDLVRRLVTLQDSEVSREVTADAVKYLPELFGNRGAVGVAMALRAAGAPPEGENLAASLVVLVGDIVNSLNAT
jgi:hypothetical protein